MEANLLLEAYLKQLHLPGFLRNYRSFAADAASNNEDHIRYLLALAEQEVRQRQLNMHRGRIKMAVTHLPTAPTTTTAAAHSVLCLAPAGSVVNRGPDKAPVSPLVIKWAHFR